MYSASGGVANGGRVHNPRPDPAEVGPPRRVNREESHIGQNVASSKRRIAWTFTLGESETIHEVVLVHSIMSYKKVIEFDGRQVHFSATASMGDWAYTMFLDGTKYAIEVRINDLESVEVPKYDLVIDRVPFRRWDVFRRRKFGSGMANASSYGHGQYQPQGQSQSGGGGGGGTYGQHRWGPSGMTAPPPMEASPPAAHQRNSGSFFRDSSGSSFQSPPPPASSHQYNGAPPPRQPAQAAPAPAAPPVKKPPQKEIDLLGDFGDSDGATVTAQQLVFDPLAGSKLGVQPVQQPIAPQQGQRTASNPAMGAVGFGAPMQPQQNPRTASNPAMGFGMQPGYVDPFASVTQPLAMKPAASSINLDPFAAQNSTYIQQQQQQQARAAPAQAMGMQYQPYQQQQQQGMPRGVAINAMPMQQQQQQPMQGGYPVGMPGGQGVGYPAKPGAVNYNISHLMNPMEVNNVRNPQQTKTINIDPFAGLKK